ncbi:MAG: Imm51 family immunity protein, partial [Polyangiales bacterium]
TRESEMSGVRTPQERGAIAALTTNGERTYSFAYADAEEPDSSVEWLQERGYAGNGYTWDGIVYGLIMRHAPATWRLLVVDSESGALYVSSHDEAAITTVARLVALAKRDPAELAAAVERAERDGAIVE